MCFRCECWYHDNFKNYKPGVLVSKPRFLLQPCDKLYRHAESTMKQIVQCSGNLSERLQRPEIPLHTPSGLLHMRIYSPSDYDSVFREDFLLLVQSFIWSTILNTHRKWGVSTMLDSSAVRNEPKARQEKLESSWMNGWSFRRWRE